LPSNLGATVGALAGSALGGPLGGVIGSTAGHGLQALVKYITGFGDYRVHYNSLMLGGAMSDGVYTPPEIINKSKDAVCLRHREYITDITATSAFTLQSFDINPGLVSTFPWLAGVAENFEEYMITGMIFEYRTLSADYTTASSAALGFVVMATQYNVLNPNFPDKKTMENYEFANSAKPSETFIHPVECKKSLNPVSELYVRTGSVPANADQRLYDLGNFQIATGGNSGTGILGELWVTFEICLFKPKLITSIGSELLTDHWISTTTGGANFFGSSRTVQPGSNLGLTVTNAFFRFPPDITDGTYLVIYQVTGGAVTVSTPATSLTNCLQLQVWQNDTNVVVDNTGNSSAIYILSFVVSITGSNAQVGFTSGSIPTSSRMDLWVTQVNGNIGS
jgi:hypothetical protein